jgi:hypothetical protein
MASWLENVFAKGEYGIPQGVLDACPPSAATRTMKSRVDELDRNWQPTGYYAWQEMADLLAAAVEMSSKASTAANQAFGDNPTSFLREAATEYAEVSRKASEDYLPIWKRAQATNAAINAPGFKRWVLDLLRAAHKLMRVSEVSVCAKPWWVGAIQGFMYYFGKVIDIALTIGRVVVKAGQAVVNAADTVFGLFPVIKWGALGIGTLFLAVFVWNKLESTAESARKPFDWSRIGSRARGLFKKPSSGGQ